MPQLTPEQLNSRLRFDFRLLRHLRSQLVEVEAYPNINSLNKRRKEILDERDAVHTRCYLATFHIKSLVGSGRYHNHFVMSLSITGNYPFAAPVTHVISDLMPWSPHFAKGVAVCIGEFWDDSRGRATIAHLIVHLCHLLNFDEMNRGGEYGGYNPESVAFWKNHLARQPITQGLEYPVLPTDLTHDAPIQTTPLFQAHPQSPQPNLFRTAQ